MSARDTNRDWSKVAEENPYWGVLSCEQFRGRELSPEARAQFFASGEELIANILAFARRHIDPQFRPRRSLDFGCGVGRLLIPMARVSQEAVGVDIAPSMLELTRRNLRAAGISNATAVTSDDTLSRVEGEFNFVNSFIVLQHIPPERGYGLIARLLQALAVGGIGSLQLTYAKEARFRPFDNARSRYFRREGAITYDLVPVATTPPEGTITMFDYDLNQLMLMVAEVAGQPVMVLPSNHDGHMGVHMIFKKVR
ncbi:MAG TPA: class I SAM-dependent methyltransferase [Acetobacteraceae bacterium]|nr:class I SAM-dependent methyltransferase [Acetobacteraceae bacterium]